MDLVYHRLATFEFFRLADLKNFLLLRYSGKMPYEINQFNGVYKFLYVFYLDLDQNASGIQYSVNIA